MTKGIRNIRAEMNVPNNRKTKVYIVSEDNDICTGIETFKESIMPLMSAGEIIVQRTKQDVDDNAVSVVVPDAVVYLPLEDLVDFEQERNRLEQEGKETEQRNQTCSGNAGKRKVCKPRA